MNVSLSSVTQTAVRSRACTSIGVGESGALASPNASAISGLACVPADAVGKARSPMKHMDANSIKPDRWDFAGFGRRDFMLGLIAPAHDRGFQVGQAPACS